MQTRPRTPQDAWCKACDWACDAACRPDLETLLGRMTDHQLSIFHGFAGQFEDDYLMNLILTSGKPAEERFAMLDARKPSFEKARLLITAEIERRNAQAAGTRESV